MELNQARIEDAIIAEVADKLIGDETLYDRAKRAFDGRVEKLWKEVAEARIRSEIELAISNGLEREYCKVDSFGQQKGEKTTIRAELEKLIGGYWNAKVDRQGKPSNGYGAELTRAEWMMTQLVAADFRGEMKQHVVNLGGSLKDKLRGELHETVNRLLSDVFNVKSADDQASDRRDRSMIQPLQKAPA
ncbi:hypothetical protein C7441_112134 [Pseudaminobacter salicylatoxidans]|uniref:Uncharacterized protein n=1 Tax=Pseudaminobacter salicylatoxidans TaxID=93369 RepID=A0A316C497_PSESE|nr:hypothetical protein [Pseudaminobacter salicylatoxidans]PWJ80592.1 hypothetical protein C7441_112134 [Pseudaminobacter salicylatoxidans]